VLEYHPINPYNDNEMQWLFVLLFERLLRPEINISHRKFPWREEHVKFWKSKPYQVVDVIKVDGWLAGYWYLTKQDEIGIRLCEKYDTIEINGKVLDHILTDVRGKEFLANVNPNHAELVQALKAHGFEICQHTYRLTK